MSTYARGARSALLIAISSGWRYELRDAGVSHRSGVLTTYGRTTTLTDAESVIAHHLGLNGGTTFLGQYRVEENR